METSSTIPYKVLKLDPQDNVRIALADLCKGEHINFDTQTYLLESAVPAKLKFSTEELAPRRQCARVPRSGGQGRGTNPSRRPVHRQ